jgi:hypothetical protein
MQKHTNQKLGKTLRYEEEFWKRLEETSGEDWYVNSAGIIRCKNSRGGCDCPLTAAYRTIKPNHKIKPFGYVQAGMGMHLSHDFIQLLAYASDIQSESIDDVYAVTRKKIMQKVGLI